jgi:DNA-binding response OmpR family regulator
MPWVAIQTEFVVIAAEVLDECVPGTDHSCRIIVFSARTSRADQNRALGAGADAYLTKPASTSQLVDQLQAVLHTS